MWDGTKLTVEIPINNNNKAVHSEDRQTGHRDDKWDTVKANGT